MERVGVGIFPEANLYQMGKIIELMGKSIKDNLFDRTILVKAKFARKEHGRDNSEKNSSVVYNRLRVDGMSQSEGTVCASDQVTVVWFGHGGHNLGQSTKFLPHHDLEGIPGVNPGDYEDLHMSAKELAKVFQFALWIVAENRDDLPFPSEIIILSCNAMKQRGVSQSENARTRSLGGEWSDVKKVQINLNKDSSYQGVPLAVRVGQHLRARYGNKPGQSLKVTAPTRPLIGAEIGTLDLRGPKAGFTTFLIDR